MDYPPLCAYTHYFMGTIVKLFMPQAITGGLSARGYADDAYISLMRAFVVLFEFVIFVPGYLKLIKSYGSNPIYKFQA